MKVVSFFLFFYSRDQRSGPFNRPPVNEAGKRRTIHRRSVSRGRPSCTVVCSVSSSEHDIVVAGDRARWTMSSDFDVSKESRPFRGTWKSRGNFGR